MLTELRERGGGVVFWKQTAAKRRWWLLLRFMTVSESNLPTKFTYLILVYSAEPHKSNCSTNLASRNAGKRSFWYTLESDRKCRAAAWRLNLPNISRISLAQLRVCTAQNALYPRLSWNLQWRVAPVTGSVQKPVCDRGCAKFASCVYEQLQPQRASCQLR